MSTLNDGLQRINKYGVEFWKAIGIEKFLDKIVGILEKFLKK